MSLSKCLTLVALLTVLNSQSNALVAADWKFLQPIKSMPSFDWQTFSFRSQSPDDELSASEEFETKVHTPLIGEYVAVTGLNLITLQGVGLVTGLDGTGSDPPPSAFRTQLYQEMKRRGVTKPNQVLKDRSTALVVVRAYLPPLVQIGDKFDVEVRVPGKSTATSLNGGWLTETLLTEQAFVPRQGVLKGRVFAKAAGPILISAGDGNSSDLAGVIRRGRVPGGGVSKKDRDMSLYLRNDYRSVRNADRISKRIGLRFHQYDRHGLSKPLAKALTDQKIKLQIHNRYRDNFPRYTQVIKSISFREDEVGERVRLQKLKKELLNPAKSEKTAIKLEAIGLNAIPVLKTGLRSPLLEVRFHSAVSLAYLGRSDGLAALAEAAEKERAFRIFAFAALSVIDDAEANLKLYNLLNGASAETRYGAFRTLTTMDARDPNIAGDKLNDGEYVLHSLDVGGPPMVHLTTHKKSEIVLFGSEMKLTTPIAVQAGRRIRITAQPGSDTLLVSRYQLGTKDVRVAVPTRVEDVIRKVAELGASYPDVAQMLFQLSRQGNLKARLEIDALPESGRVYNRAASGEAGGSRKTRARVGNSKMAPNLFDAGQTSPTKNRPPSKDQKPGDSKSDSDDSSGDQGTASVVDLTESKSPSNSTDQDRKGFFERFRFPVKRTGFVEPANIEDDE